MNTNELHKVAGAAKDNALFVPKMMGATAGGSLGGGLVGGGVGAGLGALYGASSSDVDPSVAALLGAGLGGGIGQIGGQLAGHGYGVKWNKYPVNPRNYLLPLAGSVPGAVVAAAALNDEENQNIPLALGGLGLSGLGMLATKKFMKK